MNADLHMAEDLKNTGKGNLFVIFGEPNVDILDAPDGQLQVKVNGVDVFDPSTGEIRSDKALKTTLRPAIEPRQSGHEPAQAGPHQGQTLLVGAGLRRRGCPLQECIESVADNAELEDVYDTERHLLYVACTRARDHLLVTSVDPASEFLDDLTGCD